MRTKVCILTLGCPKNITDSEAIFNEINAFGDCDWTEEPASANIILLNTCGFVKDAINETLNYVSTLQSLKQRHPNVVVIVYGCAVTRLLADGVPLGRQYPLIDYFVPIADKSSIITYLQRFRSNTPKHPTTTPATATNPFHYAYLKISDGCNRHCAFCTIPNIKGNYTSASVGSLISLAKQHLAAGKRELILIGQETTNYGTDSGSSLYELVDNLAVINGLHWLRIMYAHPLSFDLRLLDQMLRYHNLCRYIDIPLQHINDSVLARMGRKHGRAQTLQLIDTIRDRVPDVRLRSTFITGFPGETAAQHDELARFLGAARLDRVGIFKYSKEAGTVAAGLANQLAAKEKQRRYDELMSVQQQVSLSLNRRLVGQKVEVLVENCSDDCYIGRTEFDAPDVDCDVQIPVSACANPLVLGDFVECTVTDASHYSLQARVVNNV